MTRNRPRRKLWLVAAFAWTAIACTAPEPPLSAPKIVRSYLSAPPVSLSILGTAGDTNSEIIASLITDSLVQYDAELNLQPRLAESWTLSEDRTVVTFRLRRGVTWHDGEPVTSRDVMYTVAMVQQPVLENRTYATAFSPEAVRVSAPDDYTVQVTYANPTPDSLGIWKLPIVPFHVASRDGTPEEHPEGLLDGEFARHPIGCGPFRFVRYEPDQEIVLEANPDYWDGPPSIAGLAFRIFKEQRTAYQAFVNGDLDLMAATSDLWNAARESGDPRIDAFFFYRLSVWQTTWNQDGSNPFFTDPRVRRAMVLALDRRTFIDTLLDGLARPGITAVHPDSFWFDDELEPWGYDPDEARRLLDDAGWVDTDGDGVRDRNGVPFAFTHLMATSSQPVVEQMAAWTQQSWAEIGVHAEIEQLEYSAFREKRNARSFQATSFALNLGGTPEDLRDLFHSGSRDQGWNFSGIADPELDRLIEAGGAEFDTDKRRAIYDRVQERLHELEPMTCVFHFATPVLVDKRLGGVHPSPVDYWRTTQGPRVWTWNAAD